MAQLGNPFIAIVPKQLSGGELAQAIRTDIAGEWEAIIGYEAHAMATTDERVKKILYHIAEEEKHHVGELQELLAILNPQEGQAIEAGKQEVQTARANNFQQLQ